MATALSQSLLARIILGYMAAWIGIVIGWYFPFNAGFGYSPILRDPILPLKFLAISLVTNIITILLTALELGCFGVFVFNGSLSWWFWGVILITHALTSYAIKRSWAS